MICRKPNDHVSLARCNSMTADRTSEQCTGLAAYVAAPPVAPNHRPNSGGTKGSRTMSALSICACVSLTVGYLLLAGVEILRVFSH